MDVRPGRLANVVCLAPSTSLPVLAPNNVRVRNVRTLRNIRNMSGHILFGTFGHRAMSNVQCPTYDVQRTMSTVRCQPYDVHRTMSNIQCPTYNVRNMPKNVQNIVRHVRHVPGSREQPRSMTLLSDWDFIPPGPSKSFCKRVARSVILLTSCRLERFGNTLHVRA